MYDEVHQGPQGDKEGFCPSHVSFRIFVHAFGLNLKKNALLNVILFNSLAYSGAVTEVPYSHQFNKCASIICPGTHYK